MALIYAAMKLLDYTTEAALLPRQVCPNLGQAVKRLAHAMSRAGLVSDAAILAGDVLRREAEGGTALPEGLVLPHARSETVTGVCLGVATLLRPVPARGSEGEDRQVDVVVLLTGPADQTRAMLRVMARVAREVRTGDLLERLRGAADRRAMTAVLAGIETDQV